MYAPEDKDPPEGKELPNLFGLYISKVIPSSSPAVLNADVTRVLKQVKRSFTKNCYTNFQQRDLKFTSSQPSRAHCNSTIIYFYQREQNLTQFIKVCSSNFLKCFIRQFSSDFSTVKVLRYTVFLGCYHMVGNFGNANVW